MGSRFRYTGRTEIQATQQNRPRRTVQFERKPSQRFARRQSHVLRERQRDRAGYQAPPVPAAEESTSNSSVTPSPSIETVIQNHIMPSTSADIEQTTNRSSRRSIKSVSSQEEGLTVKMTSFGKAGINLK